MEPLFTVYSWRGELVSEEEYLKKESEAVGEGKKLSELAKPVYPYKTGVEY